MIYKSGNIASQWTIEETYGTSVKSAWGDILYNCERILISVVSAHFLINERESMKVLKKNHGSLCHPSVNYLKEYTKI